MQRSIDVASTSGMTGIHRERWGGVNPNFLFQIFRQGHKASSFEKGLAPYSSFWAIPGK